MRILLVEDDEAILDGLSFCLKKEGFDVSCANKAEDALNLALNQFFDLLILDINLPDMNGLKLYQKIKESIWKFRIYR